MSEPTTPIDRRTRELTILNAVAQTLNLSISLDAALRATLARAAELLNLHAGWIWLLNEEDGEHYLAAAQNLPPVLASNPHKMEGWCQCVEEYLEGGLAEAENIDVITCTRLKGVVEGADGLRYHASVPLHAYGRQIGILNVASADWCELSSDDLSLLYTIGDMLSIAIERARLYARSTALGAAAERNRLAREIHDTLAQGLSAIALQLETADALLDAPDAGATVRTSVSIAGARRAVQQALLLARANLEEARRSVLDLRAAPLEGRTLVGALAGLASDITAQGDGQTLATLATVGGGRPLPVNVEVGLYRVAQEAAANALRHARARRIEIALTTTPAAVRLLIADDGQGFDPEQVHPDRYGLAGMNERIRLLGGALHVRSAPGAGTQIEAVVPLEG